MNRFKSLFASEESLLEALKTLCAELNGHLAEVDAALRLVAGPDSHGSASGGGGQADCVDRGPLAQTHAEQLLKRCLELRAVLARLASGAPAAPAASTCGERPLESAELARDELLRMTGELAGLGGWEFDPATGEGRWTEQAARIHDLDPSMQPARFLALSFLTEDSRSRMTSALNDAVALGLPFDLELAMVSALGTRKSVRIKGIPVFRDGRVELVRGILQDISEQKRIEESLAESQALMAAIVKTAVDAIITIDRQGTVHSFNPAAERMFGFHAEEIVGQGIAVLMLPPHETEHSRYVERFLTSGQARWLGTDYEILAVRKDGSTLPIELGASKVELHGTPLIVGIVRDVSEARRVQQALHDSERRYRRIVETAREGVWVLDVDGKTVFVNARMAEILGCGVQELEHAQVDDFLAPELRSVFRERLDRRRLGVGETYDFEFRRKDGRPIWVIVSASAFADEEGHTIGVLKMVSDVSERRQAQQDLQASEQRFRDIASSIPGVVFQFRCRPDGSYYFSYLNPKAQDILNLAVPIGSPDWRLGSGIHPLDREAFLASVMKAITTRTGWRFEARTLRADGGSAWIEGMASPHVEDQEVVFDGVLFDITARKRTEEEVRALNARTRGPGRRANRRAGVDARQRDRRPGVLRSAGAVHPGQLLPGRVQRHLGGGPHRPRAA